MYWNKTYYEIFDDIPNVNLGVLFQGDGRLPSPSFFGNLIWNIFMQNSIQEQTPSRIQEGMDSSDGSADILDSIISDLMTSASDTPRMVPESRMNATSKGEDF